MSQHPTYPPPSEPSSTPHFGGPSGSSGSSGSGGFGTHDSTSSPFEPAVTSLTPGAGQSGSSGDSGTSGTSGNAGDWGNAGDSGNAAHPADSGHTADSASTVEDATAKVAATADTAKQEVAAVASDVKEHTQDVAAHAAEETKAVVAEGLEHAKALFLQSRSEMAQQASAQQEKVAGSLRSLIDEFEQMLAGTQQQGLASQAVSTLSGHAQTAADFLEQRDFNGVIDEVTSFARRRPGAFLLGAALAGLVAGRMTRGLTSDAGSPAPSTQSAPSAPLASPTTHPHFPDGDRL